MANPPEFWTFAAANMLAFVLGSVLTGLSWYAYLNRRRASLRDATVGFGTLTLGMIVEPVYQIGIRGGYVLGGRELLAIQTIEATFLSVGLGMLFYSVYRRTDAVRRTHTNVDDPVRESGDETRR